MNRNPYSLLFGKEPPQIISRTAQITHILNAFNNDIAPQQVFVITGVRGSGKTVMMTEISKKLQKDKTWITVELNPEKDMLEMLGASLSGENQLAQLFQKAEINLSFFGFGLSVKGSAPITNIEVALAKMLETLKKQGKKVLITIDEAINTKEMRLFASAFQILIRKDLPLYLLMTGLYENINDLQNEKNLTFLYRAPKVELKPLDVRMIAENYKKNLPVAEETAMQMARITKGYSFAFQVLGYFAFEQQEFTNEVINHFREYLEQYAYEKIWMELSQKDKLLTYGIAKTKSGKIAEIRQYLEIETNQFNPYRRRLIRKGIIDGSRYGYVYFTLPLFDEYVISMYESEIDDYHTVI